jgi:hypothetical protein
MPVERGDEFGEQHRDFRYRDALFQRGAAAHALAQTQAGVLGDEPPALRYRLNHGELPVGLRLHDQFARAEPEGMRGVGQFPRRFHPPHAGTRRAHRPLHEGRKILHAREIVGRGNHDRFGLRHADFRQRAKRGNLVPHMHERGEGRHDRAERQARLQRRQNRDLLLRRKQQIDPPLPNDAFGGVEPAERIEPETRNRVHSARMPRETGQAERSRGQNLDLMAERTELTRDLPRCEPRAFGEQDAHEKLVARCRTRFAGRRGCFAVKK